MQFELISKHLAALFLLLYFWLFFLYCTLIPFHSLLYLLTLPYPTALLLAVLCFSRSSVASCMAHSLSFFCCFFLYLFSNVTSSTSSCPFIILCCIYAHPLFILIPSSTCFTLLSYISFTFLLLSSFLIWKDNDRKQVRKIWHVRHAYIIVSEFIQVWRHPYLLISDVILAICKLTVWKNETLQFLSKMPAGIGLNLIVHGFTVKILNYPLISTIVSIISLLPCGIMSLCICVCDRKESYIPV